MNVEKGIITSIENDEARVKPLKTKDITKPLKIPSNIDKSELSKGDKVAFVVFDDMTGVILAIL